MIGDFFIWLGRSIHQAMCLHLYEAKRSAAGAFTWRECSHCGRKRDWTHYR